MLRLTGSTCINVSVDFSQESFYLLARRRLRAALAFWGYSRRLWLPAPRVNLRHKSSVMNTRRHQISDEGNEGMGQIGLALFARELLYCVHQIKVALHCLGLKLFHAFHPVFLTCLGQDFLLHCSRRRNLKKIFNKFRSRTLTEAAGKNL